MFNLTYSTYDKNNKRIENTLLYIKKEQQRIIDQSLHSSYNAFQEKLIEIIDGIFLNMLPFNQGNAIDKINDELLRQKDMVIYKKKNAFDRIEKLTHRLEEECINYLLYIIADSKNSLLINRPRGIL